MKLFIWDSNRINISEVILDNKESVKITLSIKSFSTTIGSKTNSSFFSYTIKIPYLINRDSLSSAVDFNATSAIDLQGIELNVLFESGFFSSRGVLKINGFTKENGIYYLQGQFLGGIKNWATKLPTYLRELESGELAYDETTITTVFNNPAPYDGTIPLWYSLKNYGRFNDSSTVLPADFYPDVYLASIIKNIESLTGIPIKSHFFSTEYFRRMLLPYMGESRTITYVAVIAELTSDLNLPISDFINISIAPWNLTLNPLNVVQLGFPTTLLQLDNQHVRVEIDFDVNLTSGSKVLVLVDENLKKYDQVTLTQGNNQLVLEGNLENRRRMVLIVDGPITLLTGSSFRVIYKGITPYIGTIIKNDWAIPDELETNDFISAISDLFNLIWFYDEMNERLIVEPKWPARLPTGEFTPGFYQGIALNEDYSKYLECSIDEAQFKVDTSTKRQLSFVFSKDDGDGNTTEDTFSHTEKLTPKYNDGITKQENELFAGTINKILPEPYTTPPPLTEPVNPPWIPTFEKKDSSEKNFDFKHRILYKMGLITGTWSFNNNTLSVAPIAAQFLQVEPSLVVSGTNEVNIGYGTISGIPGLVSIFYSKDFEILKYGQRKKMKLNIPLVDALNYEKLFRYLKFVGMVESGTSFCILEKLQLNIKEDSVSEVELITII